MVFAIPRFAMLLLAATPVWADECTNDPTCSPSEGGLSLLQTRASKLSSGGGGIVSMTQSHASEGVNNCPFAPDSGFAHCCKEKDHTKAQKCVDKAAVDLCKKKYPKASKADLDKCAKGALAPPPGACPFAPDSGFAHCCKEKDLMKCADKAAVDLCKKKYPKASKADLDKCAKGALAPLKGPPPGACPFAPDSGFAHCCKEKDHMKAQKCADKAAVDLCKKKYPKASKADLDKCAKGALVPPPDASICPFAPDSGFFHCCKAKDVAEGKKCADKAAVDLCKKKYPKASKADLDKCAKGALAPLLGPGR